LDDQKASKPTYTNWYWVWVQTNARWKIPSHYLDKCDLQD